MSYRPPLNQSFFFLSILYLSLSWGLGCRDIKKSRGKSEQKSSDFPLFKHLGQLFGRIQRCSQASLRRHIVPPVCSGSYPWCPPGRVCLKHPTEESSRKHPNQMLESPQLDPLNVETQCLYSKSLLHDWTFHPISKGESKHPAEHTHFVLLHPWSYSFSNWPELVTIDKVGT